MRSILCLILGLVAVGAGGSIQQLHAQSTSWEEVEQISDSLRTAKLYVEYQQYFQAVRNSDLYEEGDCALQSLIIHKIGVSYYYLEDYEQAAQIWRDTVIPRRLNCSQVTPDELANTYYTLARAYYLLGNPFEEGAAMEQALQILTNYAAAEPTDLAYKLLNAGKFFYRIEDYAKAEQYFSQSEQQLIKANAISGKQAIELYGWWSYLASDLGQFERALSLANKAESIALQSTELNEKDYSLVDSYKAKSLLYVGRFDEALQYAQNAYARDAIRQDSIYFSTYYELFGTVYKRKGQYQAAENAYQQALALNPPPKEGSISLGRAWNFENLADVEVLRENWSQALDYYQLSIQQLLPEFDPSDNLLSPTLDQQPIGATKHLRRVLSLKAKALDGYYQQNQDIQYLEAERNTYHALDTLVTLMRRQFSLADSKHTLMKDLVSDYEAAINTNLDLYERRQDPTDLQEAYRLCAQNKALLLLEGLQNEDALRFADIPEGLLQTEARLQSAFFRFQWLSTKTESAEQAAIYRDSLFRISEEYRRFIKTLESDYPAYHELKYDLPSLETLSDVQTQLPEDALLIEFFIGDANLFVFAITPDQIDYRRIAKPANFEQDVIRLRQLSENADTNSVQQLSHLSYELYQILLADVLAAHPAKRLIIIPDALLLTISFDALLTAPTDAPQIRTWPFLIKDYPISYLYSSRLLQQPFKSRRLRKATSPFGGFGIEYDAQMLERLEQLHANSPDSNAFRGLGLLKYSDDEVLRIADLLSGDARVNEQATLAAFLANNQKYRILHLAMHGIVDEEDPLQSALIFASTNDQSEYLLRAATLYELDLPTEMTVLSACHTAYGQVARGEGIRSLARAFTYAGSASLVASLWAASDQATQNIMISFYENLQIGMPRDEALQQAKLRYLRDAPPMYIHPSYWAPLVLIGERTPIHFTDYRKWWWLLPIGFGMVILGFLWYHRMQR